MNCTTVLADIRYALRQLRMSPGFTLTAVITIAIAIGANTAIFTLVHGILLRQLPFRDPGRLYSLNAYWNVGYDSGSHAADNGAAVFRKNGESFSSFETATIYNVTSVNFSIKGAPPARLQAAEVSVQFLDALGVTPMLGKGFSIFDDTPGNDRVVLISHRFWRQSFASDPSVIGHTLHLNALNFTIIGVLPQRMDFPSHADVWTPTIFDTHIALRDGGPFIPSVIVRLKPGISSHCAIAELSARAVTDHRGKMLTSEEHASLTSIIKALTQSVRPSLYILSGAVAFVLLIACANLAGLMLVRTAERGTELAVRTALGASRSRLIQQQLVESILIALFGAGVGILIAHGALRALYLFRPAVLAQFPRPAVESGVLVFTTVLAVFTGVLFGIVPAWIAAHQGPEAVLKACTWRTNPRRSRFRKGLVITEIALSLVLLVGAGLLLRTIYNLNQTSLGFDVENRLSFMVSLHGAPYDSGGKPYEQRAGRFENDQSMRAIDTFYTNALERVSRIPGVLDAAMISNLPLGINADMLFAVKSQNRLIAAAPRVASSGYFRVMGISLIRGREFSAGDTSDSGKVVVITRNLAERLWPGKDPIGQQLRCDWFCEPSATVIGVVEPLHIYGPRSDLQMEFYLPYSQVRWTAATFVLRTGTDPKDLIKSVRQAIAEVDPGQPVYNIETMQGRLNDEESLERFHFFALSVFAGISIAMALIGLYGVISYSVIQRTREIGVRMALGAERAQIARAFLGESILLTANGCVIGLAAAFYLSRLLSATLYGVTAGDPWTLLAVAILFCIMAALASWLPAHRAASVDPIEALRSE